VVLAQISAGAAEALFQELGAMQPSRSTLDRLPRTVSAHWEAHRSEWEAALQTQETVPAEAVTLAISVDGVMVPLKPPAAERWERATKRTAPGKQASGSTGYREVGCGTLTLYDRRGERLATVQYARMPEAKKETLAAQLQAEAHAILGARPDLRRVYLADGAESNWDLLAAVDQAVGSNPLKSVQIVDFYHACEHLKGGCDAIWGESAVQGQAEVAASGPSQRLPTVPSGLCARSTTTAGGPAVRAASGLCRLDIFPPPASAHALCGLSTPAPPDWQWGGGGRL
jgi:hypothetical protein